MEKELDQAWVMDVAWDLEPIFKFMDHSWKEALQPPKAAEIAKVINDLWLDLRADQIEVATGGIIIRIDEEDQPVISYRKEITFEYNKGDPFSV